MPLLMMAAKRRGERGETRERQVEGKCHLPLSIWVCQRGRSCPPLGHHHLPLPSPPYLSPFCLLRFICHFFYCFNMLIAFTALLLLSFLFCCCCYCLCFFPSSPPFGISFLSFLKLFWVRLVYPLHPFPTVCLWG